MTAVKAGRLIDRGVIGWNTRVRDVFPEYQTFHSSFHDVNLEQLLCHRGGVQDTPTFESLHQSQLNLQTGTLVSMRRWVSSTVLKDSPQVAVGTYLYSNQGYTVAASMIEIVTGKSWEQLVEEEVFKPLRMTTATFGQVYDGSLPPKAPCGHDLPSGATLATPRNPLSAAAHTRYQASNGPGGYVACQLQDWAKFLHVMVTSDVSDYLTSATASRLQQPYSGSEGYGRGIAVAIRSWATPGPALNHSGDIFGQDTVVWMAPGRDFIVVVFTNCRSADSSTALALDDVASLLVGRYSAATPSGPLLERPNAVTASRTGASVAVEWPTLPGVSYRMDWSSDCSSWTPLNGVDGQVATSLKTSYSEPITGSPRFYRIFTAD